MQNKSYDIEVFTEIILANTAFRSGYYNLAKQLYIHSYYKYPLFEDEILFNLELLLDSIGEQESEINISELLKSPPNNLFTSCQGKAITPKGEYFTEGPKNENGFYVSDDEDPYFLLNINSKALMPGKYCISFNFFSEQDLSDQQVKLYVDYGEGFLESSVFSFPLKTGLNEYVWDLEKSPLNIRFDPFEIKAVFCIYSFQLKAIKGVDSFHNLPVKREKSSTNTQHSGNVYHFKSNNSVFTQEIYDVEKYADTYKDLVKHGEDLEKHYLDKGFSQGRRLFYKQKYLNTLNGNTLTKIDDYKRYKVTRGRAKTVVFTFNSDPSMQIVNPELINKNFDYFYFGAPTSSDVNTVWEYIDSGFFIDNIGLLEAFHCLNIDILFPKYKNIAWIESFDYQGTDTFKNIDKFFGAKKHSVYVIGKKEVLESEQAISINFDNVFNMFTSSDENYFEVLNPNCIIINNKNRVDLRLFSEWWRVLVKYQINKCLPVDLIDKLDGMHYHEDTVRPKQNFDSARYLSEVKEHQYNLIGHYSAPEKHIKSLNELSVSIVIPVFNAFEDVQLCIKSIKNSTFKNYQIIIADDGSEEEVQNWLLSYAAANNNVKVLIPDKNRGYTKNVNSAIKHLSTDFIILLNSDTQVYGSWIEQLLFPFLKDPSVGISGPLSNAGGWQTVPNLRGNSALPAHLDIKKVNEFLQNEAYSESYAISDIINGFCFCFSKEVKKKVGVFDEQEFPLGYGEEDDFCIRARRAGFKNVVVTTAYVHHSKSKSFGHDKRVKLANAGRQVLDYKYGKEGYKLLTESIGSNPIINIKRDKLRNFFKSCKTETTIIGEDISLIPESELIYSNVFDKKVCVHLHLHYVEMLDYFFFYLNKMPVNFDLYVTTGLNEDSRAIIAQLSKIKNVGDVVVHRYENHGRDVLPLIKTIGDVFTEYDYFLHIHSKKSIHNLLGSKWLNRLMSHLLYSPDYILNILQIMDQDNIGLMYPPVLEELYPNYKWGRNKKLAIETLQKMGIKIQDETEGPMSFPAGNMFWGSTEAFTKLFMSEITEADFPKEPISVDGTLAHTLERVYGYIVEDSGHKTAIIKPKHIKPFENEKEMFSQKMMTLESIYEVIINKLEKKQPLSLVRFFDGEGAIYKAESWSDDFVQNRMTYYFGKNKYIKDDVIFIKNAIISALDQTDIVGIPNLDIVENMLEFIEIYANSEINKVPIMDRRYNTSIDINSVWRIASSFELVINSLANQNIGYCTKDVHYDLVLSGYLYRILNRVSHVSIISSQPVKEYLEKLFSIQVIEYTIPSRSIDKDSRASTSHYPNRFNELKAELGSKKLNGQLFLIGAGPLGKVYCKIVKEQGGVAIDIGAVFDSWINFRTRPEHATKSSTFNNKLLLTSQNIIELTDNEVVPSATVRISDLPNQKVNKFISHLFKD